MTLKLGDHVFIESLRKTGEVTSEPSGGRCRVQIGGLAMTCRIEDLRLIPKKKNGGGNRDLGDGKPIWSNLAEVIWQSGGKFNLAASTIWHNLESGASVLFYSLAEKSMWQSGILGQSGTIWQSGGAAWQADRFCRLAASPGSRE